MLKKLLVFAAILGLFSVFILRAQNGAFPQSGGTVSLLGSSGNPVNNAIWVTTSDVILANPTSVGIAIPSSSLSLTARFQTTGGAITTVQNLQTGYTLAANTEGSLLYIVPTANEWLVDLTFAVNSGNVQYGQFSVQLFAGQSCGNLSLSGTGTITTAQFNTCTGNSPLLQAGYVSTFQGMSWPYVMQPTVPTNQGVNVSVQPSNPAAGATLTYNAFAGNRHQILSVYVQLQTSAQAGNRFVFLQQNCNTTNGWIIVSPYAQGPNTLSAIAFFPGAVPNLSGTTVTLPMPNLTFVGANDVCNGFTIGVSGIQSSDQLQLAQFREQQWIETN